MSAKNNSIKRRKIDGSASTDAVCCLTDLPNEALIHVATFLAPPSRALFAASLDGSSGSSHENFSAIFPGNLSIGSGGPVNFHEISAQLALDHVQKILWEIEALNRTDILDFGKISKELVLQLSDDGIKTILLYVDAVNTVKRLKLANCIGITGIGLEPLRDSTMIEQIDLSLVGEHQNSKIDPEPPISCDAVLPILDRIISQNECALKHLQFPEKWQRERELQREWDSQYQEFISEYGRDPKFRQFISGYDEMLTNRGGVRCLQCNENLPRQGEEWIYTNVGRQNYTCYGCLKNYCDECEDDDGGCVLRRCNQCERRYCQQCEGMNYCEECCEYFCADCKEVGQCALCDRSECKECVGMECFECGYICSDCLDNMGEHRRDCKCCGKSFCPDCECERDDETAALDPCTGCVQLASLELAEENEQLKSEVEDLKEQVEKLKIGVKKLRRKLRQRN